ncbi:hypothetical protein ACQP2F_07925 [Actinoplanes sp. CA-030573]|uniref:hypothetical protein n=1 Tax=Actinoplanes sp. CA-030573 TaxID=3239898 RepID=UPI003D927B07
MTSAAPAVGALRRLLSELGEDWRTGAVEVGGRPGGVLYLVAGRIAYAETPATPTLGERLVASGRVSPAAWNAARAEGRGARLLVRDGLIGPNELALRLVAAIGDATRLLLRSEGAPLRFVPGARHWLGVVVPHRVPGPDLYRRSVTNAPRPRPGRSRSTACGSRP